MTAMHITSQSNSTDATPAKGKQHPKDSGAAATESQFAAWLAILFPQANPMGTPADRSGHPPSGKSAQLPSDAMEAKGVGASRAIVEIPSSAKLASAAGLTSALGKTVKMEDLTKSDPQTRMMSLATAERNQLEMGQKSAARATGLALTPLDALSTVTVAKLNAAELAKQSSAVFARGLDVSKEAGGVADRALIDGTEPNTSLHTASTSPNAGHSDTRSTRVQPLAMSSLLTSSSPGTTVGFSKGNTHHQGMSDDSARVPIKRPALSTLSGTQQNTGTGAMFDSSLARVSTSDGSLSTPNGGVVDVNHPDWPAQLAAAVSNANNMNQIQVRVHPEGLGDLVITASHSDNGIMVHVAATNAALAGQLDKSTEEIREAMRAQGLDVSNVAISLGNAASDLQQQAERDRRHIPVPTLKPFSGSLAVAATSDVERASIQTLSAEWRSSSSLINLRV